MLQILKPNPKPERDVGLVNYVSPDQVFATAVAFLRRQYPFVLIALLATLTLGATYLLVTRSTYTAQATLIIDTRKLQPFQSQNALFSEVPVDSPAVESQLEIIKSDNIARAVIRDLHLANDPEFARYGGGLIGNALFYLYAIFEPGDNSEEEIERRALREFSNNMNAKRIGLTYVIEISYSSAKPERAAQIANALADAYINDQFDAKYQSARRAGNWLADRIRELKDQASSADRTIADFKSQNNIIDAGGRSISEQQVAELNSQILAARTGTAEAKARLDRIDQIMQSDVREATVTDTLRSDVVSKLRSQFLDLANREADLSARYGSSHLAAVNLRNQMREIAKSIAAELARIAETYKSDYQIAKQREDEAQRALDAAVARSQVSGQAEVQLKELESNSQTYRSLYENFLQRYTESIQQQSFPITEARIISTAGRPAKRSSPKTVLVLATALGSGLVLGFGIGLMRDLSDRAIRTTDQAEAIVGVDCLATLPVLTNADRVTEEPSADPRAIRTHAGAFCAVIDNPFSQYTEGVRSIKVAIDLNSSSRTGRIVGFSSALPNEGKSTTAAALGLLCAQAGAKTILIDADLRNPSLTKLMSPNVKAGLLEILSGKAELDEVVCADAASGLRFLPTVMESPIAHSSEILASDNMHRLIEGLSKTYDYVIVDLSPLAPVIDVRSTGHFVPSYVLIVEWGKTHIDVLERSLASTKNFRENLLGVVLNKANTDLLRRYEGYGSSYYYHPNYSRQANT